MIPFHLDILRFVFVLCLHYAGPVSGREFCYTDSSGQDVYCDSNCCGNNPMYCCDKDSFVLNCAVFGSLGVLYVLTMTVCCIYRKRQETKKRTAAEKAQAKSLRPPAPRVNTISTGVLSQDQNPTSSNSDNNQQR